MKVIRSAWMVGFVLAGCGVAQVSTVAGRGESGQVERGVVLRRLSQVQYFGFWGSSLDGAPDAMDATAGFTNLVHVRGTLGSAELATRLTRARANGQRVVLHVQNVFFPWQSSRMVADPTGAFSAAAAALAPFDDVILGAYLFDEPFENNRAAGWDSVPPAQLQASLESAAQIIHARWPGRPVLLSYSWPEVTAALAVPPSVDWAAVNCYATWESGGQCSDAQTTALLEQLRGKLHAGQRLFLTADAWWASAPDAAAEARVLARADFFYAYAEQHAEVVALMPFLFQNMPAENLWGAASMPRVEARYRQMGRVLLGLEATCVPDGSTTVGCEGVDYVRRDSCGVETGRWVNAPAPYCAPAVCAPNGSTTVGCEGVDYVRRDSCGVETERWVNAPAPYCP